VTASSAVLKKFSPEKSVESGRGTSAQSVMSDFVSIPVSAFTTRSEALVFNICLNLLCSFITGWVQSRRSNMSIMYLASFDTAS